MDVSRPCLDVLLHECPSPVLVLDEQRRYRDANEAALAFLECTKQELLTRVCDFFPDAPIGVVLERQPFGIEAAVRVGGRRKQLHLTVIRALRGAERLIVGIGQDVTEQREEQRLLQESEERLRLITDTMDDVFWLYSASPDTPLYVSPAYERIWGHPLDQVRENPRSFLDQIHPDDLARVMGEFERGIGWDVEYRIVRPDGEMRWIHDRAVPAGFDEKGHANTFAGIASDITERKRLEENLRRVNEELQRFALIVAHDLKAPLRAVHGLCSWIEEESARYLTSESRQRMRLLLERVSRMDELINGLLEYSRMGGDIQKLEEVCVGELIEQVITDGAIPGTYTITIAPDMPCFRTSRLHLQQVFSNLIGNAVSHHDRSDGRVAITVCDIGDAFEFAVTDDGPGIPAHQQQNVFEMFQTLGLSKEEGTGIGLAIVRKILESVGGCITVRSAPGEGASFRFSWPKSLHTVGDDTSERNDAQAAPRSHPDTR